MDIILEVPRTPQAYEQENPKAEIMARRSNAFLRAAQARAMMISFERQQRRSGSFFKVPSQRQSRCGRFVLYSLEVTGAAGYWIEFSTRFDSRKGQPSHARHERCLPQAMEVARLKIAKA